MGICAMDRKARSKPMRAILDRLHAFGEFDIVVFGDKCIVDDPVDEWPRVDCLLSWHSEGFPLDKVGVFKNGGGLGVLVCASMCGGPDACGARRLCALGACAWAST